MKTNFRKIGLLVLASIALTSCSDDDNNNQNDVPTAAEFALIREAAMEGITENFTFNAEDGATTFTSAKGVQITINGACLTKNGNPVTGQVQVEYAEVFDGGSMLVTDKTTMGKLPNGDMALIISGGEFYVNATQGGVQLDTSCSLQLIIPSILTGGADTEMTLWDGTIDADGNLDWDEQDQNPAGQNNIFIEGTGVNAPYYAFFNNFGWTNVDRFYSDPRPKTTILAEAPNGYNFGNSAIYLHYDGEANTLAKLDTYNATTNQFSEHYGQVPIGLECHVIFATEEAGQWRYAIKAATVAANDVYVFTNGETTLGSEAQLVAAINALP
jgi:hypothetical protein